MFAAASFTGNNKHVTVTIKPGLEQNWLAYHSPALLYVLCSAVHLWY